ncbi:hypothetical protein COTS27_00131 [Spirochaetota bacterium]|nr:hypothetical protein COTS27_00131 [Spirochaetota bacterium]
MKPSKILLLKFIEENDKFIIPVYQRNYDWDENQCQQLFSDLKLIYKQRYKENLKECFLGFIVSFYEDGEGRIVIDGQQRLTTISLLLLAMCESSKKSKATKFTERDIIDKYLIDKPSGDETEKINLKETKKDVDNYSSLVKSVISFVNEDKGEVDLKRVDLKSKIYKNYKFFIDELKKENLEKENLDLDKIYDSIEQLSIVHAFLKKGVDDPRLIFQNLNATGQPLTEADKIRNFILINKTEEEQKNYHDNWKEIEQNVIKTGKKVTYETTEFIRNFLIYEYNRFHNKGKVYFDFRDYYLEEVKNEKKFLKTLLRFSEYYQAILKPEKFENLKLKKNPNKNKEIIGLLKELQTLKVTVFNPALLALLADRNDDQIDDTQLKEILETVISYVFRRSICGLPRNALDNIFSSLISDVKKNKDFSNEQYADILKYTLKKKTSRGHFPNDYEVENSLLEKDVYLMDSVRYFLTKLENHKNKEPVDIENPTSETKIQIEHIMPQTLTSTWKKDLGEDWETTHSRYLHTLGNLTLTGHNPKLSNMPFEKKKEWFRKSRFYLNEDLKGIGKFTKEELKERTKHLTERVLKIWKYPQTSYSSDNETKASCKKIKVLDQETKILDKETEQNDFYTLEDKINVSRKEVIFLSIRNEKKAEVSSWADFYKKTIKYLLEFDRGYFEKIRTLPSIRIGSKEGAGDRSEEVADGIYINVNFDSNRILKHLGQIVDVIDFGRSNVNFRIEKISDKKTENNDFYTLENIEKVDFARKKAKKETIFLSICDEKKVKVDSFRDFYLKTVRFLLKYNPAYLEKMKKIRSIKIGREEEAGQVPREVVPGTYLDVNFDPDRIVRHLKQIVDETDFDKSDVKFWIKDKKTKNS